MNGLFGQRYSVLATEGISEMEEQMIKNKNAGLQVKKMSRLQDNNYAPTVAEDRQVCLFYIVIY